MYSYVKPTAFSLGYFIKIVSEFAHDSQAHVSNILHH